MNCEIKVTKGKLIGKTYPALMQDILKYTNNNIDESKSLYALTQTDEFKKLLNNKRPSLDDLLFYVNFDNSFENIELTKTDKKVFLDLMLNNKNSEDVKDKFVECFTTNGIFGINPTNIQKSGLFSSNTADILLGNSNNIINNIRNLYYYVTNSADYEDLPSKVIESKFVINSDGISKINPDYFTDHLNKNYAGIDTEEGIIEKAQEINDEIVLNNPDLIDNIIDEVKNKQNIVDYTAEIGPNGIEFKTKKINDTFVTLSQTFDISQNIDDTILILDNLTNLESGVSEKQIEDLEDNLISKGMDVKGLKDVMLSKSYEESQNYLTSLFNLMYDLKVNKNDSQSIIESLSEYSKIKDSFFNNNEDRSVKKTIPKLNKKGIFVNLQTRLSEELLFLSKSLIKIKDNVYTKIKDSYNSLEEMYNFILNNQNLLKDIKINDLTISNIDNYVSDKAFEIQTPSSDINNIKKIIAYKILLGSELNNNIKNIDESYLSSKELNIPEFLIDFNKKIIKNEDLKNIFYFSERGLESKFEINDYTKEVLKRELNENEYADLQQYALLSGNESLSSLKEYYQIIKTSDRNILRNYYANNPNALNNLKSPYETVGSAVIVDNLTQPFIKIKGEIYEQIKPGVYEALDIYDDNLNVYNLKQPSLSLKNWENYVIEDIFQQNIEPEVVKSEKIIDKEIKFC